MSNLSLSPPTDQFINNHTLPRIRKPYDRNPNTPLQQPPTNPFLIDAFRKREDLTFQVVDFQETDVGDLNVSYCGGCGG